MHQKAKDSPSQNTSLFRNKSDGKIYIGSCKNKLIQERIQKDYIILTTNKHSESYNNNV